MRKKLALGMCIMISILMASFAYSAPIDSQLNDIFGAGLAENSTANEQQLMGILASGIGESIGESYGAMGAEVQALIFSDGFETSSGTGTGGFDTSIWEVRYGTDNNEADIQTSQRHSGAYAAHMEEGDEGNVDITTRAGVLDLSSYDECNLSFMMMQYSVEYGDYAYVDIYDGAWHNGVLSYTNNENEGSWARETLNLSAYSLGSDFRVRWRAEYNRDEDEFYLDDVNVSCLAAANYTNGTVGINISITDKNNSPVNSTVIIRNSTGDVVYNSSNNDTGVSQGTYDIIISLEDIPITSIEIEGAEINAGTSGIVQVKELAKPGFRQSYAINPLINFTSATVTATAAGRELYKCAEWNFSAQACYGDWEKLMDITPGQEYTFVITPDDPGFGEGAGLNIALVCATAGCTDANTDVPLKNHLNATLGHNVITFAGTDQTWNTSAYDIAVISESITSANAAWLKAVAIPILTLEGANWDEFDLGTGGDSSGGASTTINITNNTHYITETFPLGVINVSTAGTNAGYMSGWSNSVVKLAHYTANPAQAKILAVESGGTLADSTTAAERRVFFGARYFANLNANGINLFNRALDWAAYNVNMPPTHTTPVLNSTYGTNTTDENLTCYNQSTADINGDPVKNIYIWYRNGTSIVELNMPFENSSGNAARDYSPYSNNGTVSGALWLPAGGFGGKGAYRFDGIDDYINLGDSYEGVTSGTIVFWVKPAETITTGWAKNQRPWGKDGDFESRWNSANGEYSVDLGAGPTMTSSTLTWTAGQWYFIAIKWTPTSQELFVNGISEDTYAGAFTPANTATPFYVGRSGSGSTFNGTVDEFRIYNIALTSSQIKALYENKTNLIASQETSVNDIWQCEVTPNDGYQDGTTLKSNNLTIVEAVETAPPVIALISPANSTYYNASNTITFAFNVSDSTGVENCSLVLNGGIYATEASITNNAENNITASIANGNYGWSIRCWDNSTNYNIGNSATRNITVAGAPDSTPPNVTNLATDNILYGRNHSALIFAVVADNIAVDTVIANVTIPNDGSEIVGLSYNVVLERYQGYFSTTNNLGTYNVTIIANDTSGNVNNSEKTTFIIVKPNVTSVKSDSPDYVEVGSVLTYTINSTASLTSGIVPLGFSNIMKLINSTNFKDSPQMIESSAGTLLIVYNENKNPNLDGGNHDIHLLRSADNGETWQKINVTDEPEHDIFPNIYEDNEGNILIVYSHVSTNASIWDECDVWIVNSSDDGQTWSEPFSIIANSSFVEREPVIAQDSSGMYYILYEDGDGEISIHNSSKFYTGWSDRIQATNNTFGDVDAEIHIVNDAFFIAWSFFDPDDTNYSDQDIAFINTTNLLVPNVLDDNKKLLTDNIYREYETSIGSDNLGNVYVAWAGTTNVSDNYWGYDEQFNRTSNQMFIARTFDNGETWNIRQFTEGNVSYGYPGVVQTGDGLYYISLLVGNDQTNAMEIGFSQRDFSPEDAINVTINDTFPAYVTPETIYNGGEQNGGLVNWLFNVVYSGQTQLAAADMRINRSTPNGTYINNTANVTYYDSDGRLIDSFIIWEETLVLDTINPSVTGIFPSIGSQVAQGSSVLISMNVTDNAYVDYVSVSITYPNSTSEIVELAFNTTSGLYEYQLPVLNELGNYSFTIFANDTNSRINNSEYSWFQIINDPPTTPTSLTCNGGSCAGTFNTTIGLNCSGSTDPNNDSIIYHVEALFAMQRGNETRLNAQFESNNESFVYYDNMYGGAAIGARADGARVLDGNCTSGYCLNVNLNEITPAAGANYSGGWNRTIEIYNLPEYVQVSFDYSLRLHDQTEQDEYIRIYYRNITSGAAVEGPARYGVAGVDGNDEFASGTVSYTAYVTNGTYMFDAGCFMLANEANENGECWIDSIKIEEINTSNTSKMWHEIGTHNETGTYTWNIFDLKPQQGVDFRCRAIDNGSYTFSGYYTTGGNATIIADVKPPKWHFNKTSPSSPAAYVSGQPNQFNITWIDNGLLDNVAIEHNFTGTAQNYSFTGSVWQPAYGSKYEFFYNYPTLPIGTYYWKSYANDTSGNSNESEVFTFIVYDSTVPFVALNFPENNYNTSAASINFNWTATDESDPVLYCNLTIDGIVNAAGIASPNATPANYTVSGLADGTHYWNVTCRDAGGNSYTSETRKFTVDATPPSVTNLVPPAGTLFNETDSITISANVTDIVGVGEVYAKITMQNGTVITVPLSPAGDNYSYTFDPGGLIGIFNITIIANDTFSNTNSTETTYFLTSMANRFLDVVDRHWRLVQYNESITSLGGDLYNIMINPISLPIKEINVISHDQSSKKWIIRIDSNIESLEDYTDSFSINLDYINYSYANYTFTANGYHLFKCAEFNFTTQQCIDGADENYTQIMTNMASGQNYTLVYSSLDPGFLLTLQGPSNTTDARFRSGAPNDNFGGSTFLRVGRSTANNIHRSIVWFNLSHLPSGINVTQANLSLYAGQIPGTDNTGARTHGVHKVQQSPARPWTELNVTWNSYNGTSNWTSGGGDFAASPTDTQSVSIADIGTRVRFDVTADVNNFTADLSRNFGWIIKDQAETSNNYRFDYASTEYSNSSFWPMLEIAYEDIAPPEVLEIIKPQPNTGFNQTNNVTITVNATDNIGIDTVLANVTWDSAWEIITLNPIGNGLYEANFTNTTWVGRYNITIIANDTSGNVNNTETTYFNVNDITNPLVSISQPAAGTNYSVSSTVGINATVIDPYYDNIDTVLANITCPHTTEIVTLAEVGNTQVFTGTFTNTTALGRCNITIIANDTSGNTNSTETTYFNIIDTANPGIVLVRPQQGTGFNQTQTVMITVNATDDIGIDAVLANVTWDAASQLVTLNPIGGDQYEGNFTNTNWVGQYNVQIIANDTSGNVNGSITTYFNVNDVTPPTITIITPTNGTKYSLGQNVTISVNATDPYYDNVDEAYANVSWSGGWEVITLAEDDDTQIFYGNFTNTSAYGRYNITIIANDTSSNSNTADGYFEVAQAVVVVQGIGCTLTETPQVVESGEKILFQADLAYTDGTPAMQANVTTANITIFRINGTNTTKLQSGSMAFLQDGIWYYEWDAGAHENGNYMGVTKIKTNEVPPKYPSCSVPFTISGRGVFKITGITPDLVNINETVRLAAEITFNGELVSASRLVNPQLWVVQINGSTQYYNETTGLGKAPGLIYLDGEFNETGVYYLNWTVEYYNRTKNVQEIVVAKDWDQKLGNISVGGNLQQLILENKQKLIELLSEMERQQEFSAEEIFLVTDAVNSMTKVANMLADGEITEDEARQAMDKINSNLENRMGGKITGRLAGIFGTAEEGSSSAWWSLALLMAVALVIVLAVKGKARQKAEATEVKEYRHDGKPRRRYEALISRLARMVMRLQNRSRHRQFEPRKEVPLTRFFKRSPAAERQQTLYESLSSGINRMGERVMMKMKHSNFAPRRKRRYEIMIDKITNNMKEAGRIRQQKAERIREERLRRELTARKARPEEIFRPAQPKKDARYIVLAKGIKQKMHEALLRRKAAKEMHKKQVREGGHTHTRVKAKELFAAIDKYKTEEGVYEGMIRDQPAERIAEEYDACAARAAVFEESRAITGLRNAVAAIKDTIPSEKIKAAASKIPVPTMPKIRIPRIRMPQIDAGVRLRNAGESVKAAGISIKGKVGGIIRESRERIRAVDEARIKEKVAEMIGTDEENVREKLESKIPNSQNEVLRKIEAGKKEVKENSRKKQKGRRRYQLVAERVKRNLSKKKATGPLELLKEVVEKERIAERVASVQNEDERLENDRIRNLAWNMGQKGPGVGKSVISKAFPSEKDEGTFQSSDPEVTNLKLGKMQKLDQLRKMYEKE